MRHHGDNRPCRGGKQGRYDRETEGAGPLMPLMAQPPRRVFGIAHRDAPGVVSIPERLSRPPLWHVKVAGDPILPAAPAGAKAKFNVPITRIDPGSAGSTK